MSSAGGADSTLASGSVIQVNTSGYVEMSLTVK